MTEPTQGGRILAIASLLRMGHSPHAVMEALKYADKGDHAKALAALQRPLTRGPVARSSRNQAETRGAATGPKAVESQGGVSS